MRALELSSAIVVKLRVFTRPMPFCTNAAVWKRMLNGVCGYTDLC
jgi:hypothetical protein